MKLRRNTIRIVMTAIAITFVASCAKSNPLDEMEEWDLVYISDSTGRGVPEKYAANIERDNGKTIRVHNEVVGGLSALSVLNRLRSDLTETSTSNSLRDQIAEAEVIVFFANPRGDPSLGGVQGGMEACISYSGCRPPDDCTPELYAPYIENLESIYEEIFTLREGKPTIVRAVDFYNPLISEHRECGMEIQCIQCFDIFNAAVRQAAETFNIPLVSVYGEFNGLSHNNDPREMELIGPDGKHTSEQGQQVIADLLSGSGYEPVEP